MWGYRGTDKVAGMDRDESSWRIMDEVELDGYSSGWTLKWMDEAG